MIHTHSLFDIYTHCSTYPTTKVDHHAPAAQVSGIIDTCWKPLGVPTDELELGSRVVHNNYRRMIPWISRVQAGYQELIDLFDIHTHSLFDIYTHRLDGN